MIQTSPETVNLRFAPEPSMAALRAIRDRAWRLHARGRFARARRLLRQYDRAVGRLAGGAR